VASRSSAGVGLAGCDHGLLVDASRRLAFVACDGNARLLVVDLDQMRVTAAHRVGRSPDAFSEGMRALSANCPRAAAVMFRGMLTEVVRDKGSDAARQAPTLFQQLKVMEQEGTLHLSLVEWAAEIRLVANAAAHVDELEPVDQAEAADLARLCRHLITMVYETPARIRRARRPQPSP
jgi:hypothetical protein